ncbi:MAG: hypothetical protein KKH28_09215 [Elusimicrobia bacterium]|nr:hypothetical protein [Elusimicrobiota bacterium]
MNQDNENSAPATKGDIESAKTELRSEMQEMKTELKDDIKRVSVYMVKMEERMATKDDIKRIESKIDGILSLLDSIAGDVRRYQREDTLRGHAVIEHDEKLKDHETRLQKLETK